MVDCTKNGRTSVFARSDKLTDHIRAIHCGKSAKAVCPAPACAKISTDLDLLSIHIKSYHVGNKQGEVVEKTLRAITDAVCVDRRKCPLRFCRKRVELEDLTLHLLDHKGEMLEAAAPELVRQGYVVGKFHCEHGGGDFGPTDEWCVCGMTSIEIACPVCTSLHWDRKSLKAHIEESHVWIGQDMVRSRQRIFALIGTEAIQMLGNEAWSDIACQLTFDA